MRTEAEAGATQPEAKACQGPPGARTGRRVFPESFWRGHSPGHTLTSDFWPPELQEDQTLLF